MRILIIAMLLLSAPAMACESYEDCLNGKNEMMYLKAIAYKLDEIKKTLESQAQKKSLKVNAKRAWPISYVCGVEKVNGHTVNVYDCGAWDCHGSKECKEKGWE